MLSVRCFMVFMAAMVCVTGCERTTRELSPEPVPRVAVQVADGIPVSGMRVQGIAFWTHPAIPFRSMLLVTAGKNVHAYNIEDGAGVARIDSPGLRGGAVVHAGSGPDGGRFFTAFDEDGGVFRVFPVDNASRAFGAAEPGPEIAGGISGFCTGGTKRQSGVVRLYVIRAGQVEAFRLHAGSGPPRFVTDGVFETPEEMVVCAGDGDTGLFMAGRSGTVYRLDAETASPGLFVRSPAIDAGGLAVMPYMTGDGEGGRKAAGQLLLLMDRSDGGIHVFDGKSGARLGIVDIAGPAYPSREAGACPERVPEGGAAVLATTPENFGAVYRNGVLGLGMQGAGGGVVCLVPYNAVLNALSLQAGKAVSPHGQAERLQGALR